MKRVLFVDDEPRLLEAFQRLLRAQRVDWEMATAPNGAAALDTLANEPFDVIVTDMRMAGMDGVALLGAVQEQHPQMVRIILSGYSELEATLRTLPVAHQFLSKPCTPAVLCAVIERACALQDLLADESLRASVARMGELPSQPRMYMALTRALGDPDVSLDKVASIVEQDLGMSAKCLQLVNSAFFGLPRRASTVRQALGFLGMNVLKTLVFTVEVFHAFESGASIKLAGFGLESLQAHSLLAARLAGRLQPDVALAEVAFLAAMLHDVGKLILSLHYADQLGAVVAQAHEQAIPLHEAEYAQLGVTHAEVGAYLLGLWGLPQDVLEAVAFHHTPARLPLRGFDVLATVHVADVLAGEVLRGAGERAAADVIDEEYLAALGVLGELPAWRAIAADLAMAGAA